MARNQPLPSGGELLRLCKKLSRMSPSQLLMLIIVGLITAYLAQPLHPPENSSPPLSAVAESVMVHDGDTLRMGSQRVRLWGIDAPELEQTCRQGETSQPCGKQARDALIRLIGQAQVSCSAVDTDRYGRSVARCTANGIDLNRTMVAEGWALDYSTYSHEAYAREQELAQAGGKGIWGMQFQEPWRWRADRQSKGR